MYTPIAPVSPLAYRPDTLSYSEFVAALAPSNLVALWPLSETSGSVANDISGGGFNGTYNANITLNAITFSDGTPVPLFDASTDVIALPSASLDTPFNGAAGTMAAWLKVRAASVWTDGVSRAPFSFGVDASNRIFFNKPTVNNRFDVFYIAGGTSKQSANTSFSPSRWFHIAITWDKAADQVKVFIDGVQVGPTFTGLGTFAGTIVNGFTAIGNFTQSGGAFFWDGYIKYPVLWNKALTPAEVAALVPPGFLI